MILKSTSHNSSPQTGWVMVGCMLAGLAVASGAIGAHLIESWFESRYPDDHLRRLELWETAVRYQMYHALGLIALGLSSFLSKRSRTIVGFMMLIGVTLFSGCLYAYAITNIRPLVHIVPLGGMTLIASWAIFAWTSLRSSKLDLEEPSPEAVS